MRTEFGLSLGKTATPPFEYCGGGTGGGGGVSTGPHCLADCTVILPLNQYGGWTVHCSVGAVHRPRRLAHQPQRQGTRSHNQTGPVYQTHRSCRKPCHAVHRRPVEPGHNSHNFVRAGTEPRETKPVLAWRAGELRASTQPILFPVPHLILIDHQLIISRKRFEL